MPLPHDAALTIRSSDKRPSLPALLRNPPRTPRPLTHQSTTNYNRRAEQACDGPFFLRGPFFLHAPSPSTTRPVPFSVPTSRTLQIEFLIPDPGPLRRCPRFLALTCVSIPLDRPNERPSCPSSPATKKERARSATLKDRPFTRTTGSGRLTRPLPPVAYRFTVLAITSQIFTHASSRLALILASDLSGGITA